MSNLSHLEKSQHFKYRYQQEIQAMMYTFGDVRNPLQETTFLVEDITICQILELISQAYGVALKRGSKYINVEDLIFLCRKEPLKVIRMKEFLSWKDVRKNAKDDPDGNAVVAVDDTVATGDKDVKPKKKQVKLHFDYLSALENLVDSEDDENESGDDEISLLDLQIKQEATRKLREADILTSHMSREEYIDYSECRQASFTFKKAKKFREWLSINSAAMSGSESKSSASSALSPALKINDDVVEILGFLCWDIVSRLTEAALKVKILTERKYCKENDSFDEEEDIDGSDDADLMDEDNGDEDSMIVDEEDGEIKFRKRKFTTDVERRKKKQQIRISETLVWPRDSTPIQPNHVLEAYRRLQERKVPLNPFTKGLIRKKQILI